ncbi:radical SAM protein [bacterium]|nr:radical SAM protein [bacterium]
MRIILVQLPIPQHNFSRQTGNIPIGASCLKEAVRHYAGLEVELLPESQVSYLGDAALVELILQKGPDIVGFTVYAWNVERTLFLCDRLKSRRAVRIVLGGPEVTQDNALFTGHDRDDLCQGEGEAFFQELISGELAGSMTGKRKQMVEPWSFQSAVSPYLSCDLEPWLDRMMVLETMRGCPHTCSFCYYNKARSKLTFLPSDLVIKAIEWAKSQGIPEIFLLDPSLEVRPDLEDVLEQIARVNCTRDIAFQSEIRAERIDDHVAAAFAEAGFVEFEIGLQSSDLKVLSRVKRKTDLTRFVKGIHNLHKHDIRTRVDLILGLPGDTRSGFCRSVDFLVEHDCAQDVSIFPLALLPGSELRLKSGEYGLQFQDRPPYSVLETPTMTCEDMLEAFCYAEEKLGYVLQPEPELDVSYRTFDKCPESGTEGKSEIGHVPWLTSVLKDGPVYSKLIFEGEPGLWLNRVPGHHLAQPYQVFIFSGPESYSALEAELVRLTGENPFTPLEIIVFNWDRPELIRALENSLRLIRPQYLDLDMPFWGSRAAVFTLVSEIDRPLFGGTMKRQVYWWKEERLPSESDLVRLKHLDGLLIDNHVSEREIFAWQDRFSAIAPELILVSFAVIEHQRRWLELISPDEYWFGLEKNESGLGRTGI